MENNTQNHSSSLRPAYEAPELEVALVWGGGVRTADSYVYSKDAADNDLDSKNLFG